MRMENGHLLQRKMGTCQTKRGTYQRWEGERALLKINRGTCQSKRGTFPM